MENFQLTITKIPHLNVIVIKQRGIHYFLAAPDSFLIDKEGFLNLIRGAMSIDFITKEEISGIGMENEN
jgi:hypothetical protein